MSSGDWVSFSLRHCLVEICDGLPTSIKYWTEEFFFIASTAFFGPTAYGDKAVNPSPDLNPEKQSIVDLLSENYVKWTRVDEVTLGMARMSSYWNKLGRKHVEILAGREVTLLERLHHKRLASFALVTEEITIPNSLPFLIL
ncbi:unnamed protein product [Lactuca virosa]|uniref:Uncharacterized protein n=1 Tax=Lactuca virosa TaxID=75947 RepID=A0AAU9NJI5_9ASTR|nr:unnamed protein product [Lactuca virosa]